MIEEWNGLPNEVKETNSATNFKRLYRRHCMGRHSGALLRMKRTTEQLISATELRHRHQGPMRTADDQQTKSVKVKVPGVLDPYPDPDSESRSRGL